MRTLPRAAALWTAALILLGSGCTKRETPAEEGIRSRTLLIGNAAEPAALDPHLINAYTDMRISMALLEGLTVFDEKTSLPRPGAAERWNVSTDGLTYTFHLRANGKWSDGQPLTAEDFVYSFRRILTPALGSQYAYMLWPIKNAEAFNAGKQPDFSTVGLKALDDHTLQVTLERPTAYLLALAAHCTWFPVSKRAVEKVGRMDARDNPWSRPGKFVGNGAFVLSEWKPNARIVVTKNPHYWGAAQNQIERVMFFPIEKSDAEELSYRAGQLHVSLNLPPSKLAVYRRQSPDQLRIAPQLSTQYINFNTTQPPLNDRRVRRALALAVDRQAISDRIFAAARLPAPTFVPPNCGGYTPPPGQTTDFAAARALLAEAGFPGGKGLPVLPMQIFNNATDPQTAQILQATWQRELGVQITLEQLEQKTLFQNQQSMSHTIGSLAWIADYPDPYTFLEIFRTGNGNNWTGWSSRAYDALVDEANSTMDTAKRLALLQRAETLLLEEAPLAPVTYGAATYVVHPAVRNWESSPLGLNRYQLIELRR